MIGNDIVDINYSRSHTNWNRLRYQEKILTLEERIYLNNTSNQEQVFWRLWSMKEAAYKAYIQEFGGRFLNPKALFCNLISETLGTVSVKDKLYQTQSTCHNEYILTVATSNKHIKIETRTFDNLIDGSQSEFVHQKLLRTVANSKMLLKRDLEIRKNKDGVPSVWDKSNLQKDAISMTHCGRFGAFSFIDA